MPQIIVAADRGAAFGEGAVTFRERVNVADFESEHFAAQLVERLGWAVEDADLAEQQTPAASAEGVDLAEQQTPAPSAEGVDLAEQQTPAPSEQDAEDADRAEPDRIPATPEDAAREPEPQTDERLSVPSPA